MKKIILLLLSISIMCLLFACGKKSQPDDTTEVVTDSTSDENSVDKDVPTEVTEVKEPLVKLGNSQANMQKFGNCCFDGTNTYFATLDGIFQVESTSAAKMIIPGTCYGICSIDNKLVYIKLTKSSGEYCSYLCLYDKTSCNETSLLDLTEYSYAALLNSLGTKIYYNVNDGSVNTTYSYDLLTGESSFVCQEGRLVTETGIYYVKDYQDLMFLSFSEGTEEVIRSGDCKPLFVLNETDMYLIQSDAFYKYDLKAKTLDTIIDDQRVSAVTPVGDNYLIVINNVNLCLYDKQFNELQKIVNVEDGGIMNGVPFTYLADGKSYFTFWPGSGLFMLDEGLKSYKELEREDASENFTTDMDDFKEYEAMDRDQLRASLVWLSEYDDFGQPSEDLIPVSKQGYWGYVDINNNVVIDFYFKEARPFKNSRATVRPGDSFGVIDTKGNYVIQPEFGDIKEITDQFIMTYDEDSWGIDSYGHYKLFDLYGNSVISADCNKITIGDNERITTVEYGSSYSDADWIFRAYDYYGNLLFTNRYEIGKYSEGYAVIVSHDERIDSSFISDFRGIYTFVDVNGNRVTNDHYVVASDFKDGYAYVATGVCEENGSYNTESAYWYVIDRNFNTVYVVGSGDLECVGFYHDFLIAYIYRTDTYTFFDMKKNTAILGIGSYGIVNNACICQDASTGLYGIMDDSGLGVAWQYNEIKANDDGSFTLKRGLSEETISSDVLIIDPEHMKD